MATEEYIGQVEDMFTSILELGRTYIADCALYEIAHDRASDSDVLISCLYATQSSAPFLPHRAAVFQRLFTVMSSEGESEEHITDVMHQLGQPWPP